MFVESSERKFGTTRGSPRRSRTAKALGISRTAAKSERACERDGWGRLSDDGLGQKNPNRSEDPWGAGCPRPDFAVSVEPPFPDSELEFNGWSADTKDGDKLDVGLSYAESELKRLAPRKVPSETHTSSRTGENPPYGMIEGIVETSASFEARSAPRSYSTAGGGQQ